MPPKLLEQNLKQLRQLIGKVGEEYSMPYEQRKKKQEISHNQTQLQENKSTRKERPKTETKRPAVTELNLDDPKKMKEWQHFYRIPQDGECSKKVSSTKKHVSPKTLHSTAFRLREPDNQRHEKFYKPTNMNDTMKYNVSAQESKKPKRADPIGQYHKKMRKTAKTEQRPNVYRNSPEFLKQTKHPKDTNYNQPDDEDTLMHSIKPLSKPVLPVPPKKTIFSEDSESDDEPLFNYYLDKKDIMHNNKLPNYRSIISSDDDSEDSECILSIPQLSPKHRETPKIVEEEDDDNEEEEITLPHHEEEAYDDTKTPSDVEIKNFTPELEPDQPICIPKANMVDSLEEEEFLPEFDDRKVDDVKTQEHKNFNPTLVEEESMSDDLEFDLDQYKKQFSIEINEEDEEDYSFDLDEFQKMTGINLRDLPIEEEDTDQPFDLDAFKREIGLK